MNSLVCADGISISFEGKVIIDQLSFEVGNSEMVVLKGVSGKGKTSILQSVLGFIPLASGKIQVLDYPVNVSNIRKIRASVGYVPQEFPFNGPVYDFVNLPFSFAINRGARPGREQISNMLSKLCLDSDILDKDMIEVSGGEKQRLTIASVLLMNRQLLLLDEPVASLDDVSKRAVIDLIRESGAGVLSSSHDNQWIDQCDKIIEL